MADSSLYNEATGYSIAESIQSEEGEEREGEEGAICMQRLELAVQSLRVQLQAKPLEKRSTLLERLVADPASKHVERDLGLVVRDHVARLVDLEVPEQAGAAVEGDGLGRAGALAVRLEGEELGLLVLGGLGPVEGEGPREVAPGEIGRSAFPILCRKQRLASRLTCCCT